MFLHPPHPKCLMMLIVFEAYEDQTSSACGTHFSLRCAGIQSSPRGKGKTSLLSNKHWERVNAERVRRERRGTKYVSNYLFILCTMTKIFGLQLATADQKNCIKVQSYLLLFCELLFQGELFSHSLCNVGLNCLRRFDH